MVKPCCYRQAVKKEDSAMKPDWLEEHTTDFERAELERHEAEMKKTHKIEYTPCNDKLGEDK